MCGKFKFCFLELCGICFFFLEYFDPWLVESMDTEHGDKEDQLYIKNSHKLEKNKLLNIKMRTTGNPEKIECK